MEGIYIQEMLELIESILIFNETYTKFLQYLLSPNYIELL